MKAKEVLKKSRILYCVDPRRLSIKISNVIQLINKKVGISTYENFQLENKENLDLLSNATFPVEFDGIWYFETEDEARSFVKKQMGF